MPTLAHVVPAAGSLTLAHRAARQQNVLNAFRATEPAQIAIVLRRQRTKLQKAMGEALEAGNTQGAAALSGQLRRTVEMSLRLCGVPQAPRGGAAKERMARPVLDLEAS